MYDSLSIQYEACTIQEQTWLPSPKILYASLMFIDHADKSVSTFCAEGLVFMKYEDRSA